MKMYQVVERVVAVEEINTTVEAMTKTIVLTDAKVVVVVVVVSITALHNKLRKMSARRCGGFVRRRIGVTRQCGAWLRRAAAADAARAAAVVAA